MGLSIRAYARQRGVSHVAVLRAVKQGRVTLEPTAPLIQPRPMRPGSDRAIRLVGNRCRKNFARSHKRPWARCARR